MMLKCWSLLNLIYIKSATFRELAALQASSDGAASQREDLMPYYLFQWKYKDPAIQAMIETPQDRSAELRKAVEAFGGRMHQFFFSFGEYDGLSIVEFTNNAACASCAAFLIGAGANTSLQMTALLTANEGEAAMLRASSVQSRYRPPVGYGHG